MSGSEEISSDRNIPVQTKDIDSETTSDSIYLALESSENSESSSLVEETSTKRGRSKKRKVKNDSRSALSRGKRLKGSYKDGYRELLNETLRAIQSKSDSHESPLLPSQIGVTLWSSKEKDLFFVSLAKRGKHDVHSIATDIGSKSESEVKLYVDQLDNAVKNEQIYELNPKNLLQLYDLSPTFEVSEQLCVSLDFAAEALAVFQYKEELRAEKSKYGKLSLLTTREAKWVESRLEAHDLGEEEISKTLPAAQLLDLNMFLTLSKRVFMNSSVLENNWCSYAERRTSPSIMYTAFSDFHALAVSLTKRLVQSTLFFAMSRLRASDVLGSKISRQHVRRRDVVAALDVLGIEVNGKKTWAKTARKCKLRVYDKVRHRKTFGERYSYDEVEEILSSEQSRPRGRSIPSNESPTNVSAFSLAASLKNSSADETKKFDFSTSLSADDDGSSMSNDDGNIPLSHNDRQSRKQELLDQSHDSYADALDLRASRDEERRLWQLLGEDPESKMQPERIQIPRVPRRERKSREDLVDWRTWVDYVPEWEEFETPVPASSFEQNRRIPPRFGSDAGLTESDTELEELECAVSSRQVSARRQAKTDELIEDESSSELQSDMEIEDDIATSDLDEDHISSESRSTEAERETHSDIEDLVGSSQGRGMAIDECRRGRARKDKEEEISNENSSEYSVHDEGSRR